MSWFQTRARAEASLRDRGRLFHHPLPTVIELMLFDRMPRKEVKFTRHNISGRALIADFDELRGVMGVYARDLDIGR